MSKHAILSASSAHRWLICTRAPRLEQEFADNSGEAAAEGSAAHALAEHKLRKALKLRTKRPVSKYDSDEMEAATDGYVDFVLEILAGLKQTCSDPTILIEQRLDFSRFVPDGFGTGDCVVIGDRTLHIVDFKFGWTLVHAEENPQMKLYGLSALELFDGIYDISEVSMSIYQPRRENASTYTVFKESLYQWAEEILVPTAKLAFEGGGEFVPGDHCQFCRAAVKCRARAEEKLNLARFEFSLPPVLTDDDIEGIIAKLDDLTAWANDIRNYALEAALNHGKRWCGFKLVEGRSNRRYKNEEAVAEAAKAAGYRDIYRQSLITLTEMEKLMSKAKFSEILGELIEKPPGKPALVPITDKRPEINTSAKQDFKEEI
ncbi:DUF2800 domain-containing protein [Gudongella oleilytica]|uniref:DUF2800 domain-containing protein n=1 Tax=Gudongella oleilytica TaxID=1582259 RepID=UPI000FF8A74D|nr:DUF2800 domain-containing protein [Gudongella oleilytica]